MRNIVLHLFMHTRLPISISLRLHFDLDFVSSSFIFVYLSFWLHHVCVCRVHSKVGHTHTVHEYVSHVEYFTFPLCMRSFSVRFTGSHITNGIQMYFDILFQSVDEKQNKTKNDSIIHLWYINNIHTHARPHARTLTKQTLPKHTGFERFILLFKHSIKLTVFAMKNDTRSYRHHIKDSS